jgi:mono/diheme cytochrome c family protein
VEIEMKAAFACAMVCALTFIGWSTGAAEPPPTPAEFAKGETLFGSICAHCHGPRMVNPGTVSFDLRKFPPDDRARFFNSVSNGKNNMPPWTDILKPDEIEAIWAYVRSGGKAP